MAQQSPTICQGLLTELLPAFEKIQGGSLRFKESLAALRSIRRLSSVDSLGTLSLDNGSRRNLFHLLATCLNEARILMSDQLCIIFKILADASREPKCREHFGNSESHSTHAGWPPDPKHDSYAWSHEQWSAYESGSILQAAVRTLHTRHVRQFGLAAYHALRLISNSCADSNANKRVVLECGGIELLFRCANLKLWPDIVTTALWNICAESEEQAAIENECAIEDDKVSEEPRIEPRMSLTACTQLALSSTGECDDSNGKSLLTAVLEDGRRHTNVIKELLDLADIVQDEARKEMVADLLEKTSLFVSSLYSASTKVEAERIVPRSSRLKLPDVHPKDFLRELLVGSGRDLALSHPECTCDVTSAIAVLLSRVEIQRELIHEDLVKAFLEVSSWKNVTTDGEESTSRGVPRAIFTVEQSLVKTTYEVTGSSEFISKYGRGAECPTLVSDCIDALGDLSNLRPTTKSLNLIPAALASVLLANLTTSVDFALFLVQQKEIHLPLGLILRQRKDYRTLFPALSLLHRVAIPPENKAVIFGAGVIHELPRFLIDFDVHPKIQSEAVDFMRRIITGLPQHVSGIGVSISPNEQESGKRQHPERTQEQSGLLAALNLFRRTSDLETKVEVGRLVVEVCRTLLHASKPHPERAESAVRQAFGTYSHIADPVTCLICNGPSQEIRGEGWFGLAVLSNWEYGRQFVMDSLAGEELQKKLDETLKAGDRALCQNITLMLTHLKRFPCLLVVPSTRQFLEDVASSVGIPCIWPVLAPAA